MPVVRPKVFLSSTVVDLPEYRQAAIEIFERLGFETLACHYQYPCRIVTADDPLQAENPSYLNVCLVARKVGPAPEAFVPDLAR